MGSYSKILEGVNGGTDDELELFGVNSSRDVYFVIENVFSGSGSYEFYLHDMNAGDIFANAVMGAAVGAVVETVLRPILDDDPNHNTAEEDQAYRVGTNVITNVLQGKDLPTTAKSVLIAEVEAEARRELGYGALGTLAVNFGVGWLEEVYKYY